MRKHIFIAIILMVAVSGLIFGLSMSRSSGPQNKSSKTPVRSLRELAKTQGRYTVFAQSKMAHQYDDLAALVRDSPTIITGTIEALAPQLLPPAENFIVTDCRLTVKDTVKGTVRPGETITLRLPGGRIEFDDGTSAEVELTDFLRYPEVGQTFVFFLRKKGDSKFSLQGGAQGLFEVSSKATIEPQTQALNKLAESHQNMSLKSFLKEIQQEVNVQ